MDVNKISVLKGHALIINYLIAEDIQQDHNRGFDKTVQNIPCHMPDNGVQSKGNI